MTSFTLPRNSKYYRRDRCHRNKDPHTFVSFDPSPRCYPVVGVKLTNEDVDIVLQDRPVSLREIFELAKPIYFDNFQELDFSRRLHQSRDDQNQPEDR